MKDINRVATVREKILENEKNPGQGKVREFNFQSGKFRKNEKSQGISKFSKKVASQQAPGNFSFHKLLAI